PHCISLHIVLAQKYAQLGYHDLAAGQSYKALLLCDAISDASDVYHAEAIEDQRELIQQIPLVERIRLLKGELQSDGAAMPRDARPDIDVELDYWSRKHYLPWIYLLLCRSLTLCGCFRTAHEYIIQARERKICLGDPRFSEMATRLPEVVAQHFGITLEELRKTAYWDVKQWPNQGLVRREVYPWNSWEPDRLAELPNLNAMMAKVAPKLEVRAVELPALTGNSNQKTVVQLGVFAKEDIAPGDVVLDEESLLTANNRLQDALCDACSADLPDLDDPASDDTRECPHCQAVFCSVRCAKRAQHGYHYSICEKGLDALLRDVPPAEAAESLYSLLVMRTIGMAETQECHPLELLEVKYIWGDFHNLPLTEHLIPPSTALPRTLPFSFEHNILFPMQIMEKIEIDPYSETHYDLWVFNTIYAKLRGTASARLSGLGGRPVRGPEVSAVHPMWCLANHSCDPNVSWEWGGSIKFWARKERVAWEGRGVKVVRSKAGIRKGEEVLNHYCDITLPVKERREWARGALGGDCMCARCVWEAEQADAK
ncbi:hypothetical protein BAUCODRAFT_73217, partial [Baudoinia panamericana UAMH 10762]